MNHDRPGSTSHGSYQYEKVASRREICVGGRNRKGIAIPQQDDGAEVLHLSGGSKSYNRTANSRETVRQTRQVPPLRRAVTFGSASRIERIQPPAAAHLR